MILNCYNIAKTFVDLTIVKEGSFFINDREKVALVGTNGAGKTTILRMVIGEIEPDEGSIVINKGKTIRYLSQLQKLEEGTTIYEEVKQTRGDIVKLEQKIKEVESLLNESTTPDDSLILNYHNLRQQFENLDGYAYESEVIGVLKGLGFTEEEFDKNTSTLSGGQKTRVALSKLLLSPADLLLLDEPTNHLDLQATTWLEFFLINYKGAVLLVSHDRYFLNRVVSKVIEIEQAVITTYSGNYHEYSYKKQQDREAKLKLYLNQQQEIKRQEAVIKKLKQFNREKSIKRAESREKVLDKIERVEKPKSTKHISFTLQPNIRSGNDVLTISELSKSFDDLQLFESISLEIKRGERIAIIGDNGTGKTTLLKIINQVMETNSGKIVYGSKVAIGYYDQEYQLLDDHKTIFEEIHETYPNLTGTKIRNTLATFLFTEDDVFKKIQSLSGGEKGRVSLAKLMLSETNFLIMDEPTNHLDIVSKEILEQVLRSYTGTLLFVSHDRYFINEVSTKIWELKEKTFFVYDGNYDYYLEQKERISKESKTSEKDVQLPNNTLSESKISWQEEKQNIAKERKRINDLTKTENQIHDLEEQIQEIDRLLQQEEVYTNSVSCQELVNKKKTIEKELEALYPLWESLLESH